MKHVRRLFGWILRGAGQQLMIAGVTLTALGCNREWCEDRIKEWREKRAQEKTHDHTIN